MNRSVSAAVRKKAGVEVLELYDEDVLMLWTALFDAVKEPTGLTCSGSMMDVLWDEQRTDDPKGHSTLAD